ncbi:KipI family sensor histidine kinase inhibitor [Microvirga flocculans]|uniref:KipI family sensor histidine kinase inhibitor n=1 Tax=Microvirga flocculans TaxID=217168 RepID=A0A7W6IFG2_9HYPH|nr:5-oxoprolinase subunit PxpB [Microvirga flocculans]MBB4040492.1 KipI family sensor histidine kinase inhibitor [Microvirga flocculans]
MVQIPRILPCGDSALTIEFGDAIDPEINGMVLALDDALRARAPAGLIETVPTYRSLTVQFDPLATDYDALIEALHEETKDLAPRAAKGKRWRVPVVYGGAYGIDLEEVAALHGLTPAQVIEIHASAVYRIYMIGFLPGFAYLGGLDERIATSRRVHPRARIPAGSIMIGGVQAGIAPMDMPSGWHLLGRTPVLTYAPERNPAFLFAAGDEIVFEPVDASLWDALERAALAGEPVAEEVRP